MSELRTRFAPSPTGYLHIGGARTALYCWLLARRNKGTFILRIEDTDLERSTPESVQAILDGMEWLGLDYDEGPFYQTKRFDRYKEVIQQLLEAGKAYRCYCSKERLDELRKGQMENKLKPRYDGRCRELTGQQEGSFVVRFKNPADGVVEFEDKVRGMVKFSNAELDDLIIARSDGTPTYNFTVVVDDMDMNINIVLRGDDHINNTPRQINILRALGVEPPQYAHVPMILGGDGKRLSKRHGAVSVMQYRDDGFLPEALINYLARLGWSHGDQEIFSTEELVQFFSLDALNNSPAAFNQEKLLWLNQHYMKTSNVERVAEALDYHMQLLDIDAKNGPPLTEVIKAQRERTKTLKEMAERSRFFYEDVPVTDEMRAQITPENEQALIAVRHSLADLAEWSKGAIHTAIAATADQHGLKMGKVAQPLRIILTGGNVSPPIDITIELIGQKRVLQQLDAVLNA